MRVQSSVSSLSSVTAGSVPERLLRAALELMRSEGLRGLSQARVAAAAGLRQSHLTYYFPTRRALIKALVEHIHADMVSHLEPLVVARAAAPDAVDREGLRRLRTLLSSGVSEPLIARLMLALANLTDEDPQLRSWLAAHDREMYEHMRAAFHRLGVYPADTELMLFHTSYIGMIVLSAQSGDAATVERFLQLAELAFDRLVASAARPITD